jgi:DNA-binding transcriptional LysR family regulator
MLLDKKMEVFLAVAEAGSFSLAARRLSVSQSVVSFHINTLEIELGTTLFYRQGRMISLTEEGEMLYKEGIKLARAARRLEVDFSKSSSSIALHINLAGDAMTCAFRLPATISAFQEVDPAVTFSYHHLAQDIIIEQLLDGDLDMALVGHQVRHRKIASEECSVDEIVLVASPSVKVDRIAPDELKKYPLIWVTGDRGLDLIVRKQLMDAGVALKDLNVVMELDDLSILKAFIQAEMGMAFLPKLSVTNELRFDILRTVDLDGVTIERINYLLFRKGKHPREHVERFIEFVTGLHRKNLKTE